MRVTRSTSGPALDQLADGRLGVAEAALLARLGLGLVGRGLDRALEHRRAVGLGLDLARQQRPVALALALRLELVAERDRREALGVALALELQPRSRADALGVRDHARAQPPLGVAVDALAPAALRILLCPEGRRRQ
jgi:hypothetical protein